MNSPGVPFVKASACGNDFLILEGIYAPADIGDFSRRIADRHQGVGADGVEWLFPTDGADVQASLFNADGSKAELSGNGTRCVAAYLCRQQAKPKIVIRTGAGLKTCTLISQREKQYEFELAMGQPEVGGELLLPLSQGVVRGIPVSLGNPHFVMFVPTFVAEWQQQAREIGRHHTFKHGINIELVTIANHNHIDVRFFERGVGETQSSGTGSCAAAVAAMAQNKAASPVEVHTPGGVQMVRWEEQVFLRGSAELICQGEFFV
ncbi:MAG TPA: diaminopimelate epimerase [Terriglobales bacterium]|nr:diaminopimelate epimerase [Terriglobales bacterium]